MLSIQKLLLKFTGLVRKFGRSITLIKLFSPNNHRIPAKLLSIDLRFRVVFVLIGMKIGKFRVVILWIIFLKFRDGGRRVGALRRFVRLAT